METTANKLSNVLETSDGRVLFDLNYAVGDLVALLLDESGGYTLIKIDRTHDRSMDNYLTVLNRWLDTMLPAVHTVLDVGELSLDESDPFTQYFFIDDNLLCMFTTYHVGQTPSDSVGVHQIGNPTNRRVLHIAHQCVVNGNEYAETFSVPMATAYFTAQNQKAHEQCAD